MQTEGSERSQAASEWTWTDSAQISAVENPADSATQLLSKTSVLQNLRHVWRSQDPAFASLSKEPKEEQNRVIPLHPSHTQHPRFLTICQPLRSKRKTKNSFSPAHRSGERGSKGSFQHSSQLHQALANNAHNDPPVTGSSLL